MAPSTATKLKRNNHAPELDDKGFPTESQIGKERAVLFFKLLRGLGISRQVTRFIHTIFTLTRPGEIYHFNDEFLAEHIGCDAGGTSRNYIVNLRRKMREWNDGFYDEVLHTQHFSFVSITDNEFNYKTKKQVSTGYTFSKKFADLQDDLIIKLRKHHKYETNWLQALNDVCSAAGKDDLQDFGMWNRRKDKQARSVEDILGTLLLNWKRLTRKIIETSKEFGFSPDDTAEYLQKLAPGYILQARDNAIFYSMPQVAVGVKYEKGETRHDSPDEYIANLDASKLVTIKATRSDFDEVWNKVFSYVSAREYVENGDIEFRKYKGLGGNSNVSSNGIGNDLKWTGPNGLSDKNTVLPDHRGSIQILQDAENNAALDNERERFLGKVQADNGSPKDKS